MLGYSCTVYVSVQFLNTILHYFSRYRSPYKPGNEIELLEGKFESTTEKRESFSKPNKYNLQNEGSSNHNASYSKDQREHPVDGNKLNDSYGSVASFPRNQSRKETPEYLASMWRAI